jgi:gliding motility-associated-like protein
VQAPGGPLTAFLAVQDIACFGDTTGRIDLQPGGGTLPYTFSWDNGSADEDIDSLLAGTYSVLITDVNGCTLQTSAIVNAPASPLSATLTVTDVLCGGDSTGAVFTSIAGGTPGYSVVWNNGSTDTIVVLVPSGIYSVTIADTNGCIVTASDTVLDVNPALILSANVVQPNCLTTVSGSISLSITGGVANYVYNWNTGDTTSVIDTVLPGTYIATVTDANGCTVDSSFIIVDTSNIGFVINGDSIICAGDTVLLQADVYAGISYQWFENGVALPDDTTSQLVVVANGSYSLQAGSACGIFTDGPVTVTVNSLPAVDAGTDHTIDCDSMLLLSATGATDYSWSPANLCLPPDVATTVVSPDITTWFIVTGTDANGCSASDSVLVTVSCDTLFVPSGFSPNGDNINDYFVISQLEKYPNANLKIFNRWGALVYEKDKYDNTWNGLSNSDLIRMGEELPDGTYYYVLDLKDGNDPLQGFVVLRR